MGASLKSTTAVFAAAFRNRTLLRLELAWAVFNGAEWGVWIALLVYAYTHGGAAAASAHRRRAARPCIVLAPFLGALTDRRARRAGAVLQLPAHGADHGRCSRGDRRSARRAWWSLPWRPS